MKRVAILLALLSLVCSISFAQAAGDEKPQGKDPASKHAAAAAPSSKDKKTAKEEKKAEPRKEEEKKAG